MRSNQDPVQWVASIVRRLDETERLLVGIEQASGADRLDLSTTMRLALAMMAIRDAERQRAEHACDFSDLLAGLGAPASDAGQPHQTS